MNQPSLNLFVDINMVNVLTTYSFYNLILRLLYQFYSTINRTITRKPAFQIQVNRIITLSLGSIETDRVISETVFIMRLLTIDI